MRYIKYFSLLFLIALSFYFTDKIMIYMENKNPIMQEINQKADSYKTSPVNAVIEDDKIIPGINGKEINKRKSFLKMDDFGSFNETFIIYNEINPDVSLKNNIDKVIIKGNSIKRSVSFILEDDSEVESYLISQKIKYSIIANVNSDLSLQREYINGESSKEKFSDLNSLLNKNKINNKICLVDYSNVQFCLQKKYFLVTASLDMNANIIQLLSEISSGDIVLIRRKTSLDNLKLILSELKKQDLSIIYISELISESN